MDKKFPLLLFSLFAVGFICFCVAGYCFWLYLDFVNTLEYYGVDWAIALRNQDVWSTYYGLLLGIAKFSVAGIAAWSALVFLWIRKRRTRTG